MSEEVLARLAATIASRRDAAADASYTRRILDGGPAYAAKKFGEEAIETVIAALGQDRNALVSEAADALYHLLVLLEAREVSLADVLAKLEQREGRSGLAEKAARAAD